MIYILTLLVFGLTMCTSDVLPDQNFTGSFSGNQNDIDLTTVLNAKDNGLNGTVILNGRPAQLSGLIKGSTSVGTFYDTEAEVSYHFTGKLSGDELRMSVTFPELNDKVIEVIMHRNASDNSALKKTHPESNDIDHKNDVNVDVDDVKVDDINTDPENTGDEPVKPEIPQPLKIVGAKNPALVGTWRFTEDFSSGIGDEYGSFSTEYFMQFKANGTLLTWTGRSAGSTGDVGISAEGESPANADKGEWYTEGKTLYIIDPATNVKASTLFYAEENRMMLHDGGKERKVLQRVR